MTDHQHGVSVPRLAARRLTGRRPASLQLPSLLRARVVAGSEPAEDRGDQTRRPQARRWSQSGVWSAVVCGAPGDGTQLIVDWLVIAAARDGLVAEATALPETVGHPHGTLVQVAAPDAVAGMSGIRSGAVDLLVCGEHMELARALAAGMVGPGTDIIASRARRLTPLEQQLGAAQVASPAAIDAAARAAGRSYVAIDGHDVAGWYSLPVSCQSGLLLGAVCAASGAQIEPDRCREAIAALGVDENVQARAFDTGLRIGRAGGTGSRRIRTAEQFTRRRRGQLHRRQRGEFDRLISQVSHTFESQHHWVAWQMCFDLASFESVEHAARALGWLSEVHREEQAHEAAHSIRIDPDRSVVPIVAEALRRLLAYPDLPALAEAKTRRGRIAALRKAQGIARTEPFSVVDLLPADAYELAQSLPPRLGRIVDPTGSPVLCRYGVRALSVTTLRGALTLRFFRSLRRFRATSDRFAVEVDAARVYVSVVREALACSTYEVARSVASAGLGVGGAGALRAGTRTTMRGVCELLARPAMTIDRVGFPPGADPDPLVQIAPVFVPWAVRQVDEYGLPALWDLSSAITAIAMQLSRDSDHYGAVQRVRALCGLEPLEFGEEAPQDPPAEVSSVEDALPDEAHGVA